MPASSCTCSSASACLGLRSPTRPLMSPIRGYRMNSGSLRGQCNTRRQKRKKVRSLSPTARLLCLVPPVMLTDSIRILLSALSGSSSRKKKVNTPNAQKRKDLLQPAPSAKDKKKKKKTWQRDHWMPERGNADWNPAHFIKHPISSVHS